MTKLENFINKKKIIIFDLDGVLIDSKKNMKASWSKVKKEFKITVSFEQYFALIGRPFRTILKNLGIKKVMHEEIFQTFNSESKKKINLIQPYRNVLKTLKKLKLKKKTIGILTSKNKERAQFIMKKLKINYNFLVCPKTNLPGKPNPKQINQLIKNRLFNKKDIVFVGDTYIDYKTAKNAKIDFIFAKYGYGNTMKIYNLKINKIKEII